MGSNKIIGFISLRLICSLSLFLIISVLFNTAYAADTEKVTRCVSTFSTITESVNKFFIVCISIWAALYIGQRVKDKYKDMSGISVIMKFFFYVICYGVFMVTVFATNLITYTIFEDYMEYAVYVSVFAISFLLMNYTEEYNKKLVKNMEGVALFRFFIKVIAMSVAASFISSYIYWIQVLAELFRIILMHLDSTLLECL